MFDTSGVRLVGELDNDEGDNDEERLLVVEIDEGDEQSSLLICDDTLSFSQSCSLIIIMRLDVDDVVISTSSSELVDSKDREQLLLLL